MQLMLLIAVSAKSDADRNEFVIYARGSKDCDENTRSVWADVGWTFGNVCF